MSSKSKNIEDNKSTSVTDECNSRPKICGVIRPIASMQPPEYTESHWNEVYDVIKMAINQAGFEPRTVSDAKHVNLIHGSIINNLYDDEIVICDVSNKNANVMFELGIRLAFDKPVIIIKDNKTGYSFDINGIKHLEYSFDLQFNKTKKFIDELASHITQTTQACADGTYTSFLSQYKNVRVENNHITAQKIESESIDIGTAINTLIDKVDKLSKPSLSDYLNNTKDTQQYFRESKPVIQNQWCFRIVLEDDSKIIDVSELIIMLSSGLARMEYFDLINNNYNSIGFCLFNISILSPVMSKDELISLADRVVVELSALPVHDIYK